MTLQEYLTLRAIKPAEMAEMIGVHLATVYRLKKGDQRPTWETMLEIERVTDGAVAPNDWRRVAA